MSSSEKHCIRPSGHTYLLIFCKHIIFLLKTQFPKLSATFPSFLVLQLFNPLIISSENALPPMPTSSCCLHPLAPVPHLLAFNWEHTMLFQCVTPDQSKSEQSFRWKKSMEIYPSGSLHSKAGELLQHVTLFLITQGRSSLNLYRKSEMHLGIKNGWQLCQKSKHLVIFDHRLEKMWFSLPRVTWYFIRFLWGIISNASHPASWSFIYFSQTTEKTTAICHALNRHYATVTYQTSRIHIAQFKQTFHSSLCLFSWCQDPIEKDCIYITAL